VGELTLDDIFEVVDQFTGLEDFVQPRNLNKPSDIVRNELVVDDPSGQFIPLIDISDYQLEPSKHRQVEAYRP
jgi:hypothetical protein